MSILVIDAWAADSGDFDLPHSHTAIMVHNGSCGSFQEGFGNRRPAQGAKGDCKR